MDYDKYMGGRKLKKMGQTEQQCQQQTQIERRAILSIRSMSESLNSLFEEISMYSPSMASPTASPIKHHTNSNTTFNYTPIKQFMLAPAFKKQPNSNKTQNNPEVKPMKKKSISSVHFTNYMKPIGNVSEKVKGLLEKQKKIREMEQERSIQNAKNIKQKANQQYQCITSKYHQYQQKRSIKEQAIANRLIQKSESEMSGVTFQPKINKNIEINVPFEERLIHNERAKQLRSSEIIKEVLKGETHQPKINSHKQSQSKIKSIWKNQGKKVSSQGGTSKSFRDSSGFSEILNGLADSPLKMRTISEFEFINKK